MKLNLDNDILYINDELNIKTIDFHSVEKFIKKHPNINKISLRDVSRIDTSGAYFVLKTLKKLNLSEDALIDISDKNKKLIGLVKRNFPNKLVKDERPISVYNSIYTIGETTNNLLFELKRIIVFLGAIVIGYFNFLRRPYKEFWEIVLDITYDSTIKALSIVILLSFIIGLVLTYLPLNLMMQYGTQIFVVDMLGISSFREFAPLFTAIIIAGRSGSAFTSEIGIMKVNEEIDALQTMGEDPMQRLILPRITALMISLPVLAVVAMIANIAGGMLITYLIADITPLQFIERLFSHVSVGHFDIGLIKTPFFALVIAGIGCLQGIMVKKDSQSVGRATTTSVVYSIFLIIVVDAIFAVALNGVA